MAAIDVFTVASGLTSDGSSSPVVWPGGVGTLVSYGAFDSATVTVEANIGGVWASMGSDAEFTAEGMVNFELPPCKIRATVSSAGAGTNLSVAAKRHK
jgi:hypothetical protein